MFKKENIPWNKDTTISQLQKLLINGFNPYIDIKDSNKVLLHLVEEVGELVKAARKQEDNIKDEVGDVFILLSFYCSSIGIDLSSAVLNKIKKNIKEGKFGDNRGKNDKIS
jgi:NTP pyrophosphatase (non-canonical NTP hydrolase)